MADPKIKDYLLNDPLSEVTRKERRMLLAVNVFCIALIKAGMLPTKISALGVEFDKTNQQAFIYIVLLIAVYFFFAFIIYSAADFLAWRRALWAFRGLKIQDQMFEVDRVNPIDSETDRITWEASGASPALSKLVEPVAFIRVFFEFLLPIIVSCYSIQLLYFYSPGA